MFGSYELLRLNIPLKGLTLHPTPQAPPFSLISVNKQSLANTSAKTAKEGKSS